MGFYDRQRVSWYDKEARALLHKKQNARAPTTCKTISFPDDAEPITEFPEYKITPRGEIFNSRGQQLATSVDTKGYLKVAFYRDNQRWTRRVHVLVAQQFLPIPEGLGAHPVVDHIDQDRTHCSVDNLQWVSQSENIAKAYEQGRISSTAMPVKCIEDNKEFFSCTQAAKYYGCSKISIQDAIRKGRGGYVKSINKTFKFIEK